MGGFALESQVPGSPFFGPIRVQRNGEILPTRAGVFRNHQAAVAQWRENLVPVRVPGGIPPNPAFPGTIPEMSLQIHLAEKGFGGQVEFAGGAARPFPGDDGPGLFIFDGE